MAQGDGKDWGGGARLEHKIDEIKLSSLNARVVRFMMIWKLCTVVSSHETFAFSLLFESCKHSIFADVALYLICMNPMKSALRLAEAYDRLRHKNQETCES
jgi:hypothetical protein